MDKHSILTELKKSCATRSFTSGFEVREEFELRACDLLISNSCVGVFFAVADDPSYLLDVWKTAQGEISNLRDTARVKTLPRDLVLTLITPEKEADRALINEIVSDAYTCRKFVLPVNGEPIEKSLENLPFWPAPELEEDSSQEFGLSVDELLVKSGFDLHLVEDLGKRGVEKICASIDQGLYSLRASSEAEATRAAESKSPQKDKAEKQNRANRTTRVTKLDLSDFRGLRNLDGGLDLNANVIFLYGPNGTGKTSVFDAIEWAVTGAVTRLHSDPDRQIDWSDSLVNLFSHDNRTSVTLELSTGCNITRTKHVAAEPVNTIDGNKARESQITKTIICRESLPELDQRLIPDLIRRSHFLGQHNIREFISGGDGDRDPAVERFKVLSKLFGRDDFVKRSDKIKRLSRELLSMRLALQEELNSKRESLSLLTSRIQERKAAFVERVKVAQGGSLVEAEVQHLAQQLELVQIQIASLVPAEVDAHHSLATYLTDVESSLNERKGHLQKRIERLLSLSRQAERRQERLAAIDELDVKINNVSADIKIKESELEDLNRKLQSLTAELLKSQEEEDGLSIELHRVNELIRCAPGLAKAKKDVAVHQEKLDEIKKQRDISSAERATLLGKVGELEVSLSASRSDLESRKAVRDRLVGLVNAFDELNELMMTAQLTGERRKAVSESIEENSRLLAEHTGLLAERTKDLAAVEDSLTITSQQRQRKTDLLAELEQYIDSAQCPFCGHGHKSEAALRAHVKQQLSLVPEALTQLIARKEALSAEVASLNQRIKTRRKSVSELMAERDAININFKSTREKIERWRLEALNLGVITTGTAFEDVIAKRGLHVDDSQYMSALNSVLDLEQRVDEYRQQLNQVDEVVAQADAEVEKLQESVAESLSEMEYLTFQLAELNLTVDGYDEKEAEANRGVIISSLELIRRDEKFKTKDIATVKKDCQDVSRALGSLQSEHAALMRTKESLLKDEDEYVASLIAEQMPAGATATTFSEKLQGLKHQLDLCAELQLRRDHIYEAVSVEQLKRDLDTAEGELARERERLTPYEDKLSFYGLWSEELDACLMTIGAEQNTRVEEQLKSFEPTINKICQRLSPHPLFEEIRLNVTSKRDGKEGALQIYAGLTGGEKDVGTESVQGVPPSSFFSEAQMNILALSIFLTCAIRQSWSGFRLIAIDDPVQQMDDLNANAFFDLIRGLVPSGHQFLIATCDLRLYRMALEKFSCLNSAGKKKFLAYRLKGVSKQGPKIIADISK